MICIYLVVLIMGVPTPLAAELSVRDADSGHPSHGACSAPNP